MNYFITLIFNLFIDKNTVILLKFYYNANQKENAEICVHHIIPLV